eukprot:748957-Hanusia_phi.AAC.1
MSEARPISPGWPGVPAPTDSEPPRRRAASLRDSTVTVCQLTVRYGHPGTAARPRPATVGCRIVKPGHGVLR